MYLDNRLVALVCLFLFAGCAGEPKKVALPPEIVKVPQYMPLPADCGVMQPVVLPPGSTARDVMLQLKHAVEVYNDQVKRCFGVSNP
jgi:hypothetical protein